MPSPVFSQKEGGKRVDGNQYILLIAPTDEEESAIAASLSIELEDAGFSVRHASSFRETERPMLVLLSTALEKGQAVSEHIRKKQIPVFCYGKKTQWAKCPFPRPVDTAALISFLRDFG